MTADPDATTEKPAPAADTQPGAVHPPPLRRSAWTPRERAVRLLWMLLGGLLWRLLPPLRSNLLRFFGASIGPGCSFASSVRVDVPWNLKFGAGVRVREHAILYALGPITVGDHTVIDRYAHLCAGSHDFTDPRFPLTRPPITIGQRCLIGLDAYIGPGVTLGDRCTVHPRASVHRDFPSDSNLAGNPAREVSDG